MSVTIRIASKPASNQYLLHDLYLNCDMYVVYPFILSNTITIPVGAIVHGTWTPIYPLNSTVQSGLQFNASTISFDNITYNICGSTDIININTMFNSLEIDDAPFLYEIINHNTQNGLYTDSRRIVYYVTTVSTSNSNIQYVKKTVTLNDKEVDSIYFLIPGIEIGLNIVPF